MVRPCGLCPLDPCCANLISYVVDLEHCSDYRDQPDQKFEFLDDDFVYWNLAQQDSVTQKFEF